MKNPIHYSTRILKRTDRSPGAYRWAEALPGFISWFVLAFAILMAFMDTAIFAGCVLAFMIYWISGCANILLSTMKGWRRIEDTRKIDWLGRLDREFPEWKDCYYCTIVPFASESIKVLRPTIQSIASSDFPTDRKLLFLSSEAALHEGRGIAERLAAEFSGQFAGIYVIEHVLQPGELKGKASNENFCGRFAYDKIVELGIDPGKVLVSSNDSDMRIEPHFPAYLLHEYLSEGAERDMRIYQPIPSDFSDYWGASFFTRILILSGVLWRITLQVRGKTRCTVFSFYSMSMKALHDIGYWDPDVIPEDERIMFKAIERFGRKFKVHPLFTLIRGSSIRGEGFWGAVSEQYMQILRWAWGASEIAHSLSVYAVLGREGRKAMRGPILNQIRSATEWSLLPLILVFGGILPGLVEPWFVYTPFGHIYAIAMAIIALTSTCFILCTIRLEHIIAPPRPDEGFTFASLCGTASWFLSPVVSLVFGSLPAFEAQTRLIMNQRIAYVESRKE
jgi:hypothetical protein